MFHPLINGADPSAAPDTSLPQCRGGRRKNYSKVALNRGRGSGWEPGLALRLLNARLRCRQAAGTTSAYLTVSMNCRKRVSLPSWISQTWTTGTSSALPVALPVPV